MTSSGPHIRLGGRAPAPGARAALRLYAHQSEDVFVFACIRTVRASHRAKEWLSVVSELTLRLNKGTQPARSVSFGGS